MIIYVHGSHEALATHLPRASRPNSTAERWYQYSVAQYPGGFDAREIGGGAPPGGGACECLATGGGVPYSPVGDEDGGAADIGRCESDGDREGDESGYCNGSLGALEVGRTGTALRVDSSLP